MKKITSVILTLALLLAAALPAAGASGEEYAAARRMYELGLFLGRGEDAEGRPDFDLDSPAAREEAAVMLVRLYGHEGSALRMDRDCPFTDVSDWARPYVAHAAYLGLVNGRGEGLLDARSNISATEYLTMVLRALGYRSEPGEEYGTPCEKDFDWDAAWLKSDEIGLTNGEYGADTEIFTRGDMARISAAALGCALNGYDGGSTLLGHIDAADGLRNVQNVVSVTAERYDGGETVYAAGALRLMREEFAGDRLLYVHMDDICLLLAAAAGTPEVSEDVRAAGMMLFAKTLTFSVSDGAGTRALAVTAHPRPGELWRLHLTGGVRYFYSDTQTVFSEGAGYVPYVNAADLLAYFGIDQALSLHGEAEGAVVWSLADGG